MSQNPKIQTANISTSIFSYKLKDAQDEYLQLSELLNDDLGFITSLIHFFSNDTKSAIVKRLEALRPSAKDTAVISYLLDNCTLRTLQELQRIKNEYDLN